MPRLQNISKYWVSRRSAAFASLNAYSMLAPSNGACCTLLTTVGCGSPAASRTVGAMSMTWQNWTRDLALPLDAVGPVHDRAVARSAEVRCHLLGPLVGRVHRMRPAHRVVVVSVRAAEVIDLALEELRRLERAHPVEYRHLVEAPVQCAFRGRAVVADDVDRSTCRRGCSGPSANRTGGRRDGRYVRGTPRTLPSRARGST